MQLLPAFAGLAQTSLMKFESLSTDDGLSQGVVTSITEDFRGFMWIGTQNGLNRLVGRDIAVFHHHPDDPESLPSDQIETLETGPDGTIWIGMLDAGLACMDPGTVAFRSIRILNEQGADRSETVIHHIDFSDQGVLYAAAGPNGLLVLQPGQDTASVFRVAAEDWGALDIVDVCLHHGEIWLATRHRGIVMFEPGQGMLRHYFDPEPASRYHFNEATRVIPADDPWLWVGTQQSTLFKVNRLNGESVGYTQPANLRYHFANIYDMLPDSDGRLLLATGVGGLQALDPVTGQNSVLSLADDPFGVAYNTINCLYRSANGILWVGTHGKGVSMHHEGSNRFRVYSGTRPADIPLSLQSVRSIYADDSLLFIGGYNGLNRIHRESGEVVTWMSEAVAYSICEVKTNPKRLLVGGEGTGLYLFDKVKGQMQHIYLEDFGFYPLTNLDPFAFVYAIAYYEGEQYFIGHADGLAVFDVSSRRIVKNYVHRNNPGSVVPGEIKSIVVDNHDRVWVGSATGGLSRFDPVQESFVTMDSAHGFRPLPSLSVLDVFADQQGRIWVGTAEGLCQLHPDTGVEKVYTMADGLPNNVISSIEQCGHGNIWFGTNEGLSSLDPETGLVTNYTPLHGLPGKEMNRGASFRTPDGTLFFGGIDGVVSFSSDPGQFKFPDPYPQIIGYYEFNSPKELDTLLPYTNRLVVPPGVNYFSIDLTGSDVLFDAQNQFEFRVQGIYDEWINQEGNRRISFNNVSPGRYEIELKVSNDGINWFGNDPPVELIIKPLFIQTTLARILLLVLILGLLFGSIYFRTRYLTRQKNMLNSLVEQRTLELSASEQQLKEANETKDRFFSILAHDLRSPFSALLGISEILAGDWQEYSDAERRKMAHTIHLTINQTFRLLTNLLDWSRLQRGVIHPDKKKVQLRQLVSDVLEGKQMVLSSKAITVANRVPVALQSWGDPQMIEAVLRNFISNAVKYSQEGGIIEVKAEEINGVVRVVVSDQGTGMDMETQRSIFTDLEPISKPGTGGEKGTGLGLRLCNEFVQHMGGRIGFDSESGKGSDFWFTLPSAK